MKKTPVRKNARAIKAEANALPEDIDLVGVRRQIRNRVGQEAMNMVEATIAAVNSGQYAALKYLFEAVGLFPADIQDESRQQDTLAPTLLQALGLPESPVEPAVTKDSARS